MPRVGNMTPSPFLLVPSNRGKGWSLQITKTRKTFMLRVGGDRDPRMYKLGQALWLPCYLIRYGSQHNCGGEETDMQLAFGVPSLSLVAPRLSQHHK